MCWPPKEDFPEGVTFKLKLRYRGEEWGNKRRCFLRKVSVGNLGAEDNLVGLWS